MDKLDTLEKIEEYLKRADCYGDYNYCFVVQPEDTVSDVILMCFGAIGGAIAGVRKATGTIGTADKPVVMWKDYVELKENGITIADTESAAIEYICRANGVECVVIKGISDFPKNESETNKEDSHEEQLNIFLENIPKVMTKIFTEYLVYALRCNINYIEYASKSTTIGK